MTTTLHPELLAKLPPGAVTFAEFTELVLYDPELGYYATRVPGIDYETSPTISPWFGKLIARWIERAFQALGEPQDFRVIEAGGGDGSLAVAAAAGWGEGMQEISWHFIERSPKIAELQGRKVADLPLAFGWSEEMPVDGRPGVVIANEVIDNFPFHVMTVDGGELREVYISATADGLEESLGLPSDTGVAEIASAAFPYLGEGDRFEVRAQILSWVEGISRALRSGYALIIDYGDLRPELWTRRPSGSAVAYSAEGMGDALTSNADITAHVDFSQVQGAFEDAGFESRLTTQRDLLKGLGYDGIAADLRSRRSSHRPGEAVTALAEESKLSLLVRPGGLGDFLVLQAAKQAPTFWD